MVRLGCCIPGGSFMPQGENGVPQSAEEILQNGAHKILRAGYDYAEISAGFLSQLTKDQLLRLQKSNDSGELRIEACNSFIPPSLNLWDARLETKLYEYVDRVLSACAALGIRVMVFGSGGARRLPEGMSLREGHEGFVRFLRRCHPYAEKYNVMIVVEPLNHEECNVLNTVRECAEVVRAVDRPWIRLLADAFHVYKEGEDLSVLVENADILSHIHIAEPPARVYAGRDGGEYLRKFAEFLKKANYCGRVSMECGFTNFDEELKMAYPFMEEVFR